MQSYVINPVVDLRQHLQQTPDYKHITHKCCNKLFSSERLNKR